MCPTCTHTMQNVNEVFWCPRCGTIRNRITDAIPRDSIPWLAERVKVLLDLVDDEMTKRHMRHLGIVEACTTPEEREAND